MPPDLIISNAQIPDFEHRVWVSADLAIRDGRIESVAPAGSLAAAAATDRLDAGGECIVPGFMDAHCHIESSMLTPEVFAEAVFARGTTAVFADPHEIANVCGPDGVRYFLATAARTPLDLFLGVPSCVPALDTEESCGRISLDDIRALLPDPGIFGLAEIMNFPGIIHGFGDARARVEAALATGKLVDGHCPGVTGRDLQAYISNGHMDGVVRISSDHEAITADETLEKAAAGMTVMLRFGSASRDLDRLLPELLRRGANLDEHFVLCSDDLDAGDLLRDGHVDRILRRACEWFTAARVPRAEAALRALALATRAPGRHFALFFRGTNRAPRGEVAPGFQADLVALAGDPANFTVAWTMKAGSLSGDGVLPSPDTPWRVAAATLPFGKRGVAKSAGGSTRGQLATASSAGALRNSRLFKTETGRRPSQGDSGGRRTRPPDSSDPAFAPFLNTVRLATGDVRPERFFVPAPAGCGARVRVRIIELVADSLVTHEGEAELPVRDGFILPDPEQDIVRLAVVERHRGTGHVGLGFVRGLGLRRGVLATTVSHDSHNLILAGLDPTQLAAAAARLAELGGGMLALDDDGTGTELPLPVAGLMTGLGLEATARGKAALLAGAARLGSPLRNPFMTLSFLALPVIPDLKLTTRGLFDARQFQNVPLCLD